MKIGILGAGHIGAAVAKLATDQGHQVMISSRHPDALAKLASGIGCVAGTAEQAADFGEICVVALPFNARDAMPAAGLAGKVVVDTMNYYPDRDGRIAELDEYKTTTSEMVAARLPGAKVVKAFNAIMAMDLPAEGRPPVTSGRRALPLAGDDAAANKIVAQLYNEFGFDALDAGKLSESWRFERAKPGYCTVLNMAELRAAIDAATREFELPHRSWQRR